VGRTVVTPGTRAAVKALRRDAAENRLRVLEAAAQVFAERGLEGSVEEVARVAGVGMGTLYRRFPTKDDLIAELVRGLLGEVVSDAREALERYDGHGLESFLYTASAHLASQRGCLARLWWPSVAPDLVQEARGLIAELLRDAQAHKNIRDDVTASDIAVILWSIRGVIETMHSVVPDGWRRHLGILVAGLRAVPVLLPGSPLTKRQMDAITSAHEAVTPTPLAAKGATGPMGSL
jgi:AcrR family transcriptional regulator